MQLNLGPRLSAIFYACTSKGLPRRIIIATLLVFWSWICFALGEKKGLSVSLQLRDAVHQLARANGYENDNALAEFAAIKHSLELSLQTSAETKKYLFGKEQEIERLKKSIYFYRSVMAPEELQKNRKAKVFSVTLGNEENGKIPIEVVLLGNGDKSAFLKGRITLSVAGANVENNASYTLRDVYSGESDFAFKYFQKLRGVLTLPANFRPQSLYLAISLEGHKKAYETLSWSELEKS